MKSIKTKFIFVMVGALITGGIFAAISLENEDSKAANRAVVQRDANQQNNEIYHQASYSAPVPQNAPDFTNAAKETVHAVVHIRTEYERKPTIYDFFYDNRRGMSRRAVATGSGVIISEDGYIVTNNHVVTNADNIEVTLNDKRTYEAKVIGTDPSTDLALIKIDETELPYLTYGNSENLEVGEWVLAVGNPFNLTSTVTAGIVSAKARDINILGRSIGEARTAIESFIQTDAAVNKGNSGGALVNTKGELVGINAAIASNTGSYTGYSFAIPVNIVEKVVNDLLQFGRVQRGYIGVTIREMNSQLAEEEGIEKLEGIYVEGVQEGSSAEKAGIQHGDIIISVDGQKVNSTSELIGYVGQFRPGDEVDVTVKRNGKTKQYSLTLTNEQGGTELSREEPDKAMALLGARFKEADPELLDKLGIDSGVQVVEIKQNSVLGRKGIEEGFIITRIDKERISSADDIKEIMKDKRGGILMEGVYPNGTRAYYGFGL